jgi:hypothetical protein
MRRGILLLCLKIAPELHISISHRSTRSKCDCERLLEPLNRTLCDAKTKLSVAIKSTKKYKLAIKSSSWYRSPPNSNSNYFVFLHLMHVSPEPPLTKCIQTDLTTLLLQLLLQFLQIDGDATPARANQTYFF